MLGHWDQPHRDLLAVNAGLAARALGHDVSAYWAAPRTGGIFARHGGALVGGRHHEALASLMATRRVRVMRCGKTPLFHDLVTRGAATAMDLAQAPADWLAAFVELAAPAGDAAPRRLLLVPTRDLPPGLSHGIPVALAPWAAWHGAWMLPLESAASDIEGVLQLDWTAIDAVVGADGASEALAAWATAGNAPTVLHRLGEDATPDGLAFAIADQLPRAAVCGWSLTEPILAAERLPGAVRSGEALVYADDVDALVPRLAERLRALDQRVLVARYGGGEAGRLSSDRALMPCFAADVAVAVEEPGRPAFPCTASPPPAYPRVNTPPAWATIDDGQLRDWARAGKMLAAVVTHSGERSHDECLPALCDSAAHDGMHWGIGCHRQRIEQAPCVVEPLLTPLAGGGVRDRCELLLHSGGDGVLAERQVTPAALAERLAGNRDRIAALVGEQDAPTGVLCYLDADPADWRAPATAHWQALREAGFRYVLSTVAPDDDGLLYRDGDFVVLPCAGYNCFPYSPFIRLHRASDLVDRIDSRQARLGPSYLVAVIDLPVIADPVSLLHGDRYRPDHPTLGPLVRAMTRDAHHALITTTPATVARYAAIVDSGDY